MLSDIVSRIYFKKVDYDSLDDLFRDVGKQVQLLMKTKNSVVFYQLEDVDGIYVLEHSPIDLEDLYELNKFPTWLDTKEYTAVQTARLVNRIADIDKAKEELEDAKDDLASEDDDKKFGGDA